MTKAKAVTVAVAENNIVQNDILTESDSMQDAIAQEEESILSLSPSEKGTLKAIPLNQVFSVKSENYGRTLGGYHSSDALRNQLVLSLARGYKAELGLPIFYELDDEGKAKAKAELAEKIAFFDKMGQGVTTFTVPKETDGGGNKKVLVSGTKIANELRKLYKDGSNIRYGVVSANRRIDVLSIVRALQVELGIEHETKWNAIVRSYTSKAERIADTLRENSSKNLAGQKMGASDCVRAGWELLESGAKQAVFRNSGLFSSPGYGQKVEAVCRMLKWMNALNPNPLPVSTFCERIEGDNPMYSFSGIIANELLKLEGHSFEEIEAYLINPAGTEPKEKVMRRSDILALKSHKIAMIDSLVDGIVAKEPNSACLRQFTPFAGIINAALDLICKGKDLQIINGIVSEYNPMSVKTAEKSDTVA